MVPFRKATFGRVLPLGTLMQITEADNLTMVEIDAGMGAFSKQYPQMLNAGGFDDLPLEPVIADRAGFIRRTEDDDEVIIVDSTDPIGPGEVRFTDTFNGHAKRALGQDGILVTRNGVPFLQGDEITTTMRAFKALFADATCYLANIPTYVDGPMALGWPPTGPRATPPDVLQGRPDDAMIGRDYCTPDVQEAAVALPGYVARLMPGATRPGVKG